MTEWRETTMDGIVADLTNSISACQEQCDKQNPDSWERLTRDLRLNVGNFERLEEENPGKGLSFGDVAKIINRFAQRATVLCGQKGCEK